MDKRLVFATFAAAAMIATTIGARADDQAIALSKFEAEVDNSLALRASGAGIDQARASLAAARARAGPQVAAALQAGPHHDVVEPYVGRTFTEFEQSIGLRFPVLGARNAQLEDVIVGQQQLQLAELDYRATRLDLLAKVRQYYVAYWTASRLQVAAQAYAEELAGEAPASGALRTNGFWTQADQLRYSDMLDKARTAVAQSYAAQRDALLQLSLLTNRTVNPFTPVEPPFENCRTTASLAVAVAESEDPQLEKLQVQIAQTRALVPLQKWHGFDTHLNVGLHSYVDQPGGVGFGVYVAAGLLVPVHGSHEEVAERQRVEAALQQYNYQVQQRRAELHTAVTVALADRAEASRELAQAQTDYRAVAEDLRESRVRLAYVAPASLGDVQEKTQLQYASQAAIIENEGAVLLKTNDLLQVAPDACSTSIVLQHGDSNL